MGRSYLVKELPLWLFPTQFGFNKRRWIILDQKYLQLIYLSNCTSELMLSWLPPKTYWNIKTPWWRFHKCFSWNPLMKVFFSFGDLNFFTKNQNSFNFDMFYFDSFLSKLLFGGMENQKKASQFSSYGFVLYVPINNP